MNGPGADINARRAEDRGRLGRVRAFYLRWKDPVFAVVLPPTAIATVVIGLQTRGFQEARARDAKVVRVLAQEQTRISRDNAKRAKETAAAAKLSCQRSRTLGPQIANYYALDPNFPREVLKEYRATIPTVCPK